MILKLNRSQGDSVLTLKDALHPIQPWQQRQHHPSTQVPKPEAFYHLDLSSSLSPHIKSLGLMVQSPKRLLFPPLNASIQCLVHPIITPSLGHPNSLLMGLPLLHLSRLFFTLYMFCHKAIARIIPVFSLPFLKLFTGSAFLLGSSPFSS